MDHVIVQIGLLMGAAAVVAILFRLIRQPSIFSFILVGILARRLGGGLSLPHELIEVFTEIGIVLLLFMAGLEVNIVSFRRRLNTVLLNGLGQIVLNTGAGFALAILFLRVDTPVAAVYYGLCLTFSSTIIVLGTLKSRKEMESFHGQVILGLMLLQDVVAVLALSVLTGLAREGGFLPELGLLFIKLFAVGAVLYLLARTVLTPLFRYLARSAELILLGGLGYGLGIAALCELIHFSPEIGAFLAGVSLSILPYKLEIEDKVEPLKSFGVILFFITLGYRLEFARDIVTWIGPIVVSVLVVVLGKPLIVLLLGWAAKEKSRPAFLIGGTINQISEFSLILATLSLRAGVFDDRLFTIITLGCLGTIFFSCLGHQVLGPMYEKFKRPLKFMDVRAATSLVEEETGLKMDGHVVLLNYNELADTIAASYARKGEKVLVLDLDPDIHGALGGHSYIVPAYADIYDPDMWDEFHFDKAEVVISCMIGGQEAEKSIARWLREHKSQAPFIAATSSSQEALDLYESGATYVIQTDDLAAQEFRRVFDREIEKGPEAFVAIGRDHRERLAKAKEENKKLFFAV